MNNAFTKYISKLVGVVVQRCVLEAMAREQAAQVARRGVPRNAALRARESSAIAQALSRMPTTRMRVWR